MTHEDLWIARNCYAVYSRKTVAALTTTNLVAGDSRRIGISINFTPDAPAAGDIYFNLITDGNGDNNRWYFGTLRQNSEMLTIDKYGTVLCQPISILYLPIAVPSALVYICELLTDQNTPLNKQVILEDDKSWKISFPKADIGKSTLPWPGSTKPG